MIALQISVLTKGLWLYRIYGFFLGACLSKISAQIVENASSPFSFRNCPCILSSCLKSLRKFRYESPDISDNKQPVVLFEENAFSSQLLSFCESQIALSLSHMYF